MKRRTNGFGKKERSSWLSARSRQNSHRRIGLALERLEDRSLLAGLVAHWSAENTAVDAVGGNNGVLINGATYSSGQIGQHSTSMA